MRIWQVIYPTDDTAYFQAPAVEWAGIKKEAQRLAG